MLLFLLFFVLMTLESDTDGLMLYCMELAYTLVVKHHIAIVMCLSSCPLMLSDMNLGMVLEHIMEGHCEDKQKILQI